MTHTRRGGRWSAQVALIGALAAFSLLLTACAPPSVTHSPVYIRICGSSSMASLMDELTAAYAESHPNVTFHTRALNSREGLKAALQGEADIGLVARPLKNVELLDSDTGERRLSATLIASDGIAVVVNATNPVEGLSLAQLHSIYTGETWDWYDLGGSLGEMAVVTREEGSGTREVFEENVLQGERLTPRAIIMPSTEAVALYVEEHPEAIGYLSAGHGTEGFKVLSIEGVGPSVEALQRGQYLLARPFYLVTPARPAAEVEALTHFMLGRTGQAIVQRDRPGPR